MSHGLFWGDQLWSFQAGDDGCPAVLTAERVEHDARNRLGMALGHGVAQPQGSHHEGPCLPTQKCLALLVLEGEESTRSDMIWSQVKDVGHDWWFPSESVWWRSCFPWQEEQLEVFRRNIYTDFFQKCAASQDLFKQSQSRLRYIADKVSGKRTVSLFFFVARSTDCCGTTELHLTCLLLNVLNFRSQFFKKKNEVRCCKRAMTCTTSPRIKWWTISQL